MTIAKMSRAQFDLAVSLAQRADVLSDPTFNNLAKDLGVTPSQLFQDVGWIKTGNGSAWSTPGAAWTAHRQQVGKDDPKGEIRTANAMQQLQAKGPDALKAFVKLEMADPTFEKQMNALRNAVNTNDTATSDRLAEGIATQMRNRIENFDQKLKGGSIWADLIRSLYTEGTNRESMSLGTQILNYAKKTPNGPMFYDVVVGT